MEKIKNIIFDLDGTLWDSRKQVINAWKKALKNYKTINITTKELTSLMGKTNYEYKKKLFPNIDNDIADKYMKLCEEEEVSYLSIHGATLFNNTIKTIKELSKNYNLFIVSNCQNGYIESFLNHYKLNNYFKDFECNGKTGLNKTQNIKLILNRNKITNVNACYIGDTIGDYEASKNNDLLFVYAKYGFGKCPDNNYSITKIDELPSILEKINFTR